MKERINILLLEDDEGDRLQIKRALKQVHAPCECTETQDIQDALAACGERSFDCAIVDYQLPGGDGLDAIVLLHERYPHMAIIMTTGQGDEIVATDAMKRGASDYIPKSNFDAHAVWRSIQHAVERSALERTVAEQRKELETFGRQMTMIFDTIGIGDWIWDIAKDEITAHRSVWAQFGFSGLAGTAPASFFRSRRHPFDTEFIWTEAKLASQPRQPFKAEFRVVWLDGSVHWLACHGAIVVDRQDRPVQAHGLCMDVTERKRAELRLAESERRLRQQANAMPQIVWTSGGVGFMDSYNDRWYEYTGFSKDQTDKGWQSVVHPDEKAQCQQTCQRELGRGNRFELECRLQRGADGAFRWHLGRFVPYRDEEGAVLRWFATFTDVHQQKLATERLEEEIRKRALAMGQLQVREEQLEASLSEQNTLLKEVHHRVKNNLQLISSLLSLQADSLKDLTALSALRESQSRIRSMALIHEQLYGDREKGQIDFAFLTERLVNNIFESYGVPRGQLTSRFNLQPVVLTADQAIPCGLILNELVTNALKYAYPHSQPGEVRVDLRQTNLGLVIFSVSDHGVGLRPDFDFAHTNSLGLTLVRSLVEQLGAKLTVQSPPGTRFTIEFPREVRKVSATSNG